MKSSLELQAERDKAARARLKAEGIDLDAPPRREPKAARCGTEGGRSRHRRLKEPVCEACRLAFNASMRERYARNGR